MARGLEGSETRTDQGNASATLKALVSFNGRSTTMLASYWVPAFSLMRTLDSHVLIERATVETGFEVDNVGFVFSHKLDGYGEAEPRIR